MNADAQIQDPAVEVHDVEAVNAKARRELYADRIKIFPKRAKGTFRTLKWWIMAVTLGIYYLTPWLRWDRGPEAPDQAVLVDLAGRRFFFFWIEIWPQEFYYVAGMLVMAGIGLFLVTSTVGRAWCGYTCPQTVWVDLFLVVERWVEGDRNARMRLDQAPWTLGKYAKRIAKHAIWLLIAVLTGGAWIFYFADAPTLAVDFVTGEAAFVAYSTVAILTFTTYVFGGLMREQVCTYMCPWPRVQAAMLDEHSLTVSYNDWRGEPRSRHAKKAAAEGKPVGDCVDCSACVVVCPMGIDIREGQQMECITCALCIDACDNVMEKLGKEKGLISYCTLGEYNENMKIAGAEVVDRHGDTVFDTSTIDPAKVRPTGGLNPAFKHTTSAFFLRPRTLLYTAVYCGIGLAMLVTLFLRDRLDVTIAHDRNPIYVTLSDGSVRNGYELKIKNMMLRQRYFAVEIAGLEGAEVKVDQRDFGPSVFMASVDADQLQALRLFVRVPPGTLQDEETPITVTVTEIGGKGESASADAKFEAPNEAIQ